MRAIEMTGAGGAETLREADRPEPVPGPRQVAIAVAYAGLNFADVLARRGLPGYSTGWPFVPGLEVGGTITGMGPDVTGLRVGDRVVAFTVNGGGLADVVLAEADLTLPVPEGLGLAEATTVPLTWATALGLARASHAGPGDAVLVTSAAGGVGAALAQMLLRHEVSIVVGGISAAEKARALADGYVAVARGQDFLERAREAAGRRVFDVILESVGGDLLASAVPALAAGGRLVSYGAAAGQADPLPPAYRDLRVGNASVSGFSIINWARTDAPAVRSLIASVLDLTGKGLRVPSPRVIPWDDAIAAHLEQGDGISQGKTVVAL